MRLMESHAWPGNTRELKHAVLRGDPEEAPFRVWWREAGQVEERRFPLGELKRRVLKIVPGQKVAYVVDVVFSDENAAPIVALAKGSDILFIEAAFAQAETARAADRRHLTTAQAGHLARLAGVRRIEPFHFSTRYRGEEPRLLQEVAEAFGRELQAPSPHLRASCGADLVYANPGDNGPRRA